ncbi:ABC transporter ATP-binding protein [Candidatus Gracilibacteria bacterium]|nr:ABC transporter ATP-binding protein [Candidatus Gracilibacteria bacterium]
MNYTLNKSGAKAKRVSLRVSIKRLLPFLSNEKMNLLIAFIAIVINSSSNLIGPAIIGYTVDNFIKNKDFKGVLFYSTILLSIYLAGLVASYIQTKTMGGVGRRVLFRLRNSIFNKLQELPVAFFNQNKAGDLISRINSDTDKLNMFFSQALVQLVGNFFLILGAGIFLLTLNIRLGSAAILPAVGVLVLTQLISAWVNRKTLKSLQSLGGMSAEIQESLENFKVIVAFNRLDYFREKFKEANENNYTASVGAGIASNIFIPIYGFAANIAILIVIAYGVTLITAGSLSIGLLIGFILYVNSFYHPLRHLAALWSSMQLALAALDRISEVLSLKTNMEIISAKHTDSDFVIEFKDVSFSYPDGKSVLHHINLKLKKGHTYAFVGPTGGGKTTTASLMARLYDPTEGIVMLNGKDIRSYKSAERSKKIGFILQEPFLFTGTVRDNILYGNEEYINASNDELRNELEKHNLSKLLARFDKGLDTPVATSGESVSLGQKQLIAFIRAVLREPDILILDEATANIDTVTEQLLEEILEKLPKETTKVIIAHRLNTIDNADQICFVNAGEIVLAGSMEHALEMLLHGKKKS